MAISFAPSFHVEENLPTGSIWRQKSSYYPPRAYAERAQMIEQGALLAPIGEIAPAVPVGRSYASGQVVVLEENRPQFYVPEETLRLYRLLAVNAVIILTWKFSPSLHPILVHLGVPSNIAQVALQHFSIAANVCAVGFGIVVVPRAITVLGEQLGLDFCRRRAETVATKSP